MTWADAFAVVGVAWAFAFMVYQGRRTDTRPSWPRSTDPLTGPVECGGEQTHYSTALARGGRFPPRVFRRDKKEDP